MFTLLLACVPLRFEVDGTTAYMTGDLSGSAPRKVRALFEENPDLERIELVMCPGSLDDFAALEAARLVREQGVDTHVGSEGEIASGAVDFFIAGVNRSVDDGGLVGVHSWSGGALEGNELPRDDPEHALYLDYYDEMGIDEAFYWFTLDAAPSNDIHWMTQDELAEYGLITP
jgi:hypothetical protein